MFPCVDALKTLQHCSEHPRVWGGGMYGCVYMGVHGSVYGLYGCCTMCRQQVLWSHPVLCSHGAVSTRCPRGGGSQGDSAVAARTKGSACAYVHVHVYMCICICAYVHVHMCMCICAYVYVYVCMCVYESSCPVEAMCWLCYLLARQTPAPWVACCGQVVVCVVRPATKGCKKHAHCLSAQRMLQCGDFEERRLSNCTPECIAFLRRLLCTDPGQRPSVADIVSDPWLQVDMCVVIVVGRFVCANMCTAVCVHVIYDEHCCACWLCLYSIHAHNNKKSGQRRSTPVHRPPDYAELVLHTPLLFEQQTLIRCDQGDDEICRLCKEAAWAGQGEGHHSDSRDGDDFEDVIDRYVTAMMHTPN